MKRLFLICLIAFAIVFTSCLKDTSDTAGGTSASGTGENESSQDTVYVPDIDEDDMFSKRDGDASYSQSDAVFIDLGKLSDSNDSFTVSDTEISLTKAGTYVFCGTYNGRITVNATKDDKIQIVLNGASITSSDSAAIYVSCADKVFLTLEGGSKNALTSGEFASDENNIDGALFSRDDLTVNGTGSLTVNSPFGHGIVCKDDLVIAGGNITVNSASHGLDANNSVRIAQGSIAIDAGKDGIHAEDGDDSTTGFVYIAGGKLDIEAEGDGISAYLYALIADGEFDILAGGGYKNGQSHSSGGYGDFMGGGQGGRPGKPRGSTESTSGSSGEEGTSMKGIKASGDVTIRGGSFNIDSADDSVHSNSSISITGGDFSIASGDDAVHADKDLTVSGGSLDITQSYEGLEALNIAVSGGNIRLVATDDGFNSSGGTDSSGEGGRDGMFGGPGGMMSKGNGTVVISGGNIHINASGDGIDSNGSLEITGGYTVVTGPTRGDTSTLDYDTTAVISGGTFIGTGASGMAQTFSSSENQGVIAVNVGNVSANTEIRLEDEKGNTVISYSSELDFAVVILSSPEIEKGKTYTIYVGSASGSFEAE